MKRYYVTFLAGTVNLALLPVQGKEVHEMVAYRGAATAPPADDIILQNDFAGIVDIALTESEVQALQAVEGIVVEENIKRVYTYDEETPAGTLDTLYSIYNLTVGNEFSQAVNLNNAATGGPDARRVHYLTKKDGSKYAALEEAPYTTGVGRFDALKVVGDTDIVPVHVAYYDMARLWALGYKGEGMKIGFIDRNFRNGDHPDLSVSAVYDPSYNADFLYGTHSHGVLGIIAARENGSGLIGMLPDAEMYCGIDSSVLASISWLVAQGCNVINCSFGGPETPFAYEKAVYKAAEDAGVLIVASAGNGGLWPTNLGPISGTFACRNGVPVMGIRTGDVYQHSDEIHYGQVLPTQNGKEAVFACPVIALICKNIWGNPITDPNPAAPYSISRGTSFSAPMFTALYAVVAQAYPNLSPAARLELIELNGRQLEGGFIEPDLSFIKHPNPS